MNERYQLVQVEAASPEVNIGAPDKNASCIIEHIQKSQSDIIVFPELCLSGYTCGDLFYQQVLLDLCWKSLHLIRECVKNKLVFVGIPLEFQGKLYNCAVALNNEKILGIIPKTHLPNYKEFYEKRWFESGTDIPVGAVYNRNETEDDIPFGTDLLFNYMKLCVGAEICEDLWMTIPPSSHQAISGANVLVNLSASNETVAKADYRRNLVQNQSGRCIATYVYSSSGPSESTSDLVFSGHCIIADGGRILDEHNMLEDQSRDSVTAVIDLEKIHHDRKNSSKNKQERTFRTIPFGLFWKSGPTFLPIADPFPFVPKDPSLLEKRCKEILDIQCAGLMKRISQLSADSKINIGISGGLDSTLALLVAVRAFDRLQIPRSRIHGITMPGFGTSGKTRENAVELMTKLGISQEEISIRELCFQTFKNINHEPFGIKLTSLEELENGLENLPPGSQDLVFENVQARVRTLVLMSHGFVLGTGDMSELATGWCTYNGDHMSMYNVNCSIPKTLVKFLVKYVAENSEKQHIFDNRGEDVKSVLNRIADFVISPELLPTKNGEVTQSTEDSVGPYELIDFFYANMIRSGFSPNKILYLASHAFLGKYTRDEIKKHMLRFYKMFFRNQFKRNCVPDGPKVGSISLSPRGDWRMPSDGDVSAWSNSNDITS